MAYTTINKSTDYFNTVLYVGNGTAIGSGGKTVTGVGFQPDFVWGKARSGTDAVDNHVLTDAVRGATKYIKSNNTSLEATDTETLTSFTNDGFTLGSNGQMNRSGNNCVAWNWKANGAGSANTTGSINSTVSVNTTSGFSIVSYTGTGSNATVGHGLGVAPKMIYVKGRNTGSTNWLTGGTNISSNWASSLHLNTTGALDTYAYWGASAPNSNTFGLSTDGALNQNGINFIAYCFAEKTGYSKIGSYTGNGNADGSFIYTGFKPAFILQKRTANAGSWNILDNKRAGYNVDNNRLFPDTNEVENTADIVDILSNGFKWRNTGSNYNNNGENNIYMAFAEAPLVGTNNIPATAR